VSVYVKQISKMDLKLRLAQVFGSRDREKTPFEMYSGSNLFLKISKTGPLCQNMA
jgi:hypothetical protein